MIVGDTPDLGGGKRGEGDGEGRGNLALAFLIFDAFVSTLGIRP